MNFQMSEQGEPLETTGSRNNECEYRRDYAPEELREENVIEPPLPNPAKRRSIKGARAKSKPPKPASRASPQAETSPTKKGVGR